MPAQKRTIKNTAQALFYCFAGVKSEASAQPPTTLMDALGTHHQNAGNLL